MPSRVQAAPLRPAQPSNRAIWGQFTYGRGAPRGLPGGSGGGGCPIGRVPHQGATHPQSRLCGRKICASPAAAHCVSTVALPGTRPECQPRFASSSPRLPFGLARLSATSSLVGQPQTSACSSSWVLRRVRRRSGCLWSAATATRLLSRARAPSRALTLHHLTRPDLKASICHTALKRCPTALLQSAAPACRCTARCSAHSLACCGSSSRFIQTTAAT